MAVRNSSNTLIRGAANVVFVSQATVGGVPSTSGKVGFHPSGIVATKKLEKTLAQVFYEWFLQGGSIVQSLIEKG